MKKWQIILTVYLLIGACVSVATCRNFVLPNGEVTATDAAYLVVMVPAWPIAVQWWLMEHGDKVVLWTVKEPAND